MTTTTVLEKKATSIKEILLDIQELAKVDWSKLPVVQRWQWFEAPKTGTPTIFAFGELSPIGGKDSGYRICAMFKDEDEVSIYLLDTDSEESKKKPPMRYVLERSVQNYSAEAMPFQAWREAIANELNLLANDAPVREIERGAILGLLEAHKVDASAEVVAALDDLIGEIEEGLHLEGGDDDEEEEAPANGAAKPPSTQAQPTE